MKVVLAEKPSVARELAGFLGAGQRREGYLEGQGYQITWAYGHLVTLKEPGEYDPALKRWSLDTLPILPPRFQLKVVEQRLARQQFAIVKRLFRQADEIVCATDAGREGELIFRYILELSGCQDKPFRRLWLSSLTASAIRAAFQQLQPGRAYDRLYAAARCRSQADWIVGMNGTRYYTMRFGGRGRLWSVGRVQTPVLALIVRRDDAIRTFRPQPFWELITVYRATRFQFAGDRFEQEAAARAVLEQVQGQVLAITRVERKRERVLPPQLYDLTELQRDMNRRYGLSAAATLKAAQALYEAKLITYPRTDSRYLSRAVQHEVPRILEKLQPLRAADIDRLDLGALRFTARLVNDAKVGDHHAILPTGKLPGQLNSAEQKVFDAVVTRLIAAFYPACEKEITTVHARVREVPFRARGQRILEPGWTVLDPRSSSPSQPREEARELPDFRVGEQGPHQPTIERGETTPPKPYTENTLLGAMETAGRLVDEEHLREALKEKGLGTPATRAAIIETLLTRGYILRQKKSLTATDLGRYLIAVVQDQDLKSPELTGHWEAKLRKIESGGLESPDFMAEIGDYTQRIVSGEAAPDIDSRQLGPCPLCGRPVIQGKRAFGCSGWRDGCPFVLPPEHGERQFSDEEIRRLLQRRVLLEPYRTAQGDSVIAVLTDTGYVSEIPMPGSQVGGPKSGRKKARAPRRRGRQPKSPDESGETPASSAGSELGACPLCGGDVVEQKKSYSCSQWRDGCPLVIWKTIAGKRISAATARGLLTKGETSVLKGFRSRAGKTFSARLKLVDGQVKFDFD